MLNPQAVSQNAPLPTSSAHPIPPPLDHAALRPVAWWSHLLPGSPASSSITDALPAPPRNALPATSQEMYTAYADEFAQYRRRAAYPTVQPTNASFITPPAHQIQQAAVDIDTPFGLPSMQTLMSNVELAAEDHAADTPPELFDAAAFAIMNSDFNAFMIPQPQHDHCTPSSDCCDGMNWSWPATANVPQDPYNVQPFPTSLTGPFDAMTMSSNIGPIRTRSRYSFDSDTPVQGPWIDATVPSLAGYFDLETGYSTPSTVVAQELADVAELTSPKSCCTEQHAPASIAQAVASADGHQCLWFNCNQIFSTPAALTNHVNRMHIARRQPAHRCLWQGCNRANHVFRHRDKILIHIRLHTNDRPYQCDACDKQFSRVDSLEAHKKVHAVDGKAWRCRAPGCTRTYFHAKSLRKHEKTVHGLELDLKLDDTGY